MGAATLEGLAVVLKMLFQMIQLLIIASILASWIGDRSNPIVQMIHNLTDPIYRPIRKYTSRIPGPFDWAPMVVIMIIIFLEKFFESFLRSMYRGM